MLEHNSVILSTRAKNRMPVFLAMDGIECPDAQSGQLYDLRDVLISWLLDTDVPSSVARRGNIGLVPPDIRNFGPE